MTFAPNSVAGVTVMQSLALLPPLLVAIWAGGFEVALILAVAALTALVWEMLFAGVRKRAFSAHGITTALIVTLLCPTEIAPWQLAFVMSLGVVFGELMFGGRGFGFVSPAALTLSLLFVAFPDSALPTATSDLALSVLPGAVLLVAFGLVSVPVLASFGLGCLAYMVTSGYVIDLPAIAAVLSVGGLFLIADPTSSSATTIGRWVYGGLAGVLVAVFSPDGALTSEAVVAASLLASVFVPLIDHGVTLIHMRWRRHG